ncbi:MAG: nickel-responsive transcriptional regulator NikR [Atopobiaceae bacterium]|nr:nickel-responsive transcriptional regulator NikR [Atopobiaceae bacterium]
MASDLVRFSVAVPEQLLEEFDAYAARRGGTVNRSEAIRDLIRDQLVEDDLTSPDAEVVGSITMVYSHHVPGLAEHLDEVQHSYIGQIVSTMHVHLDHDNCLETLAVRGKSSLVHELADLLLGIKGVRHGKLVCVATESTIAMGEPHRHHHESDHSHDHTHDHVHES